MAWHAELVSSIVELGLVAAIFRKVFDDLPGKSLIHFAVTGNRLRSSAARIMEDVVTAAVAQKLTSGSFQGLNEVTALHATSSSSSLRMPGIGSALNVW